MDSMAISLINLPTVYIRDSKGRERQWSVWSEGDTVVSESGMVGGKPSFSVGLALRELTDFGKPIY